MRISEIRVKGLFGVFDHVIPMKMDDRITIIHGPNGYGKTAILRLVDSFFNSSYSALRAIPFKEFAVTFDNRNTLTVENATLRLRGATEPGYAFKVTLIHEDSGAVEGGFFDFSPRHLLTDEPEWLQRMKRDSNIRLIQTQRLVILTPEIGRMDAYERLDTVDDCSADLASRLTAARLPDRNDRADFVPAPVVEGHKHDRLSVYVKDVPPKLSKTDGLAARVELLKGIISERFKYKEMLITWEKGITFTAYDGAPLPLTYLSSGEQHELVLLCEFLFKTRPNSLILIDEPEISLDVVWQEQFLQDLQRITDLASFDVLIATHSPQIVYDRWDLTVELKGPDLTNRGQGRDDREITATPALHGATTD
jgi:ABC-type molybdenum transport system ATPase subunit/photorepair protein PhrA